MRNLFVLRAPRPNGGGFFVGRRHRLGLVAVSAALIVGLVAPAHAAPNVTVLVSVAYTRSAAAVEPSLNVSGALCPVSVAENSDGVAVLSAAKAAGCISSFSAVVDPDFPQFGRFLDCVSGVCAEQAPAGVMGWYWFIHLNGLLAPTGLDGYQAKDNDHYMFGYEPFPCVPFGC